MSPRPRSPLQLTREERRAMLSRHFAEVIEPLLAGDQRFSDLSVERLITAANISRSAFYAYFDDKGDLLTAMAEDIVDELFAVGQEWWGLAHDAGRAELKLALGTSVGVFRAHYTVLSAVIEASVADPRVDVPYRRLIDVVAKKLAEHIADAQAAGSADPSLDPVRTARWIVLMNERGVHLLFSQRTDDQEADRLLDALTGIVWRTLYAGFRDSEG